MTDTPRDNESRSTQFYAPGVIDDDAWFRVAAKDYELLIGECDFTQALEKVETLFDAGCGLGKFPTLLANALEEQGALPGHVVWTDLLDPSDHCIAQYRAHVPAPFQAGEGYHTAVEDFVPPERTYDLVWAIQSIYAWERDQLAASLEKVTGLAGADGDVLIFQAAGNAFYHRFHDAWRRDFSPETPAYITAEEIVESLTGRDYLHHALRFDHEVPGDDPALLEAYLRQMCFDPERPLQDFMDGAYTGALLEKHRDGTAYRFPQEVWLIGSEPVMERLGVPPG